MRKLRNKSDTRAAAMVETLKTSANIFTDQVTFDSRPCYYLSGPTSC